MGFLLHSQLASDAVAVGDLPVCRVLLMNNRHFPWLILVPRRPGMRELFDLAPDDYRMVMDEIRFTAAQAAYMTQADKMNIATLGNQVPQLHIHIIARFEKDAAWPNPVWGVGTAQPYQRQELTDIIATLQRTLNLSNITKM
jgi:diadenosine tetraphosphate (Ap4A) HIT family hydrolase